VRPCSSCLCLTTSRWVAFATRSRRLQPTACWSSSSLPAAGRAGLDAVAGTTARSWGVGAAASRAQLARLEAAAAPLADSLERHGGPFLAGPCLSAADVVAYPFLERFALALRLFQGYDLGALCGGALARWMVRACVRERWSLSHLLRLPCMRTSVPPAICVTLLALPHARPMHATVAAGATNSLCLARSGPTPPVCPLCPPPLEQAQVRSLPSTQLACAPEERLAAALRQHRSLDWFDFCRVDVGDLHPQLLRQAEGQQ
jgi:hypothetical protein